ncbi:helix-turn-helix transcriptional regulator [Altererythrobacter sp. Z27]|uniref:helix-turn-helix transcriptional regulator n=1 Tax=Altererythrobacter sp. Z27 TaxID=3461147 RepID=UPI00404486C8
MASSKVPAGITRFWGSSLGWPAWIFEGTSFAGPQSLTRKITLIDDLKLLANLLHHVGEARLVEMMLDWPRYPGEAIVLAAPDLKAAIWSRSDSIDLQNAPISVSVRSERDADVVEVSLHPELGPFRPIYEQVVLVLYFLIARSFIGMTHTSKSDLSEISIRQVHSGPIIAELLPCKVVQASSEASMAIPARLLSHSNPDFDPATWTMPVGPRQRVPRTRRRQVDAKALADAISTSLTELGRVPQLADLARMHELSERTLARNLANSGTSFRELLDQARMDLGKELLLQSDLPVHGVAERLGYSEASAFVRSFNRQFNVSPAKWRNGQRPEFR